MILVPGSFAALLALDLRLNWRSFSAMFGGSSANRSLAILVASAAILHLLAWPAVLWLAPYVHGSSRGLTPLTAILGGTFTWMIAQSLFGTTRALYDRADLDLLLSTPLPAGRIIAAKAASIAASTFGSLAVFLLPVANTGALVDGITWLGIYPVLAALSLMATAIGLCISIALFRLVGPRRARLYAQVTGAGIGGAFVLGAQIIAILPAAARTAIQAWFDGHGRATCSNVCLLLTLPASSLRGDVSAMTVLSALGLAMFAIVVRLFGERFASAAVAAAGAPAPSGSSKADHWQARFRSGVGRNLRLKEWRLMVRDPSLFAQLGLQIIYTIPVAVVLLRSNLMPTAFALVPTIVVIAAQVAGSIAWITVSGEDAPELIASAPVSLAAVDRAKLSAVVLPVLVIVGLPIVALATISLKSAAVAALFAAGGCVSTALLNFWHPMPGNRRGMLRRHQQSRLIGLVEHALAMLWAFAVVFALIDSALLFVPLAIVVTTLVFCRVKHTRRSAGGVARAIPSSAAANDAAHRSASVA